MTSKKELAELVLSLVQPGDTLTHTRCMGCLEEHIFLGLALSGTALRGRPTADTRRLEPGSVGLEVEDIAPVNVTHINRVPVEAVHLLAGSWREKMNQVSSRALGRAGIR